MFHWLTHTLRLFPGGPTVVDLLGATQNNWKMILFVLGAGLMWYTGGSDTDIHPNLSLAMKKAEPIISREYCPRGLEDLSIEGASQIVYRVAAEYDITQADLNAPKNRIYVNRRIKRLMDWLPSRCKGPGGIAVRDVTRH